MWRIQEKEESSLMDTLNKMVTGILTAVFYIFFGGVCFILGWVIRAAKKEKK